MKPTIIVNGEKADLSWAADDATLRAFVGVALDSIYGALAGSQIAEYEVRRQTGEAIDLVGPDERPYRMEDLGIEDGETLYVTRKIGVGA